MASPRKKWGMSESLFWSLVFSADLQVKVSEAVLVDGGLSPPPSKAYPGRKCYMVTVSVEGRGEHGGFGPTPGIARRAAIVEACKSFRAAASSTSESFEGMECLAGEDSSDSEVEEMLPVSPGRHGNSSSEVVVSKSAKRLDVVSRGPAHKTRLDGCPKITNGSSLGHFDPRSSSTDDYVFNMVYNLAKRKGVEIKSEVILTGPEVGKILCRLDLVV